MKHKDLARELVALAGKLVEADGPKGWEELEEMASGLSQELSRQQGRAAYVTLLHGLKEAYDLGKNS